MRKLVFVITALLSHATYAQYYNPPDGYSANLEADRQYREQIREQEQQQRVQEQLRQQQEQQDRQRREMEMQQNSYNGNITPSGR